jgi:hypothetical protein
MSILNGVETPAHSCRWEDVFSQSLALPHRLGGLQNPFKCEGIVKPFERAALTQGIPRPAENSDERLPWLHLEVLGRSRSAGLREQLSARLKHRQDGLR